VRRKGVGIVAALLLVLALIPMGVASAAQGTIKLLDTAGDDKSKYSAVASDSATHNIAVIQVTDSDLDVPSDIPATVDISSTNYEIVGRADGSTTSWTLGNTPVADQTGDNKTNTSDIDLRVLQSGDTPLVVSLNAASGAVQVFAAPAEGAASRFSQAVSESTGYATSAAAVTQLTGATQLKVTVDASAGTAGVVDVHVGGTTINPTTGVSAASQVETFSATAGAAAAAVYSTAYFTALTDTTTAAAAAGSTAVYVDFTSNAGATYAGAVTVTIAETNTVVVNYQFEDYNNTDTVTSSATTKTLTVNSGTNPTGISLTGVETGTGTGVFEERVAFIPVADLNTITLCVSSTPLTTSSDTIATLITALSTNGGCNDDTATDTSDDDIAEWLRDSVTDLRKAGAAGATALATTDVIDEVLNRTLSVSHGDIVTATYADASASSASDDATMDMVAPVISGIAPVDDAFTDDTTPRLTANVTDADAGINADDIAVLVDGAAVPNATHAGTLQKDDAGLNSFDVEFTTAALSEAAHYWELTVTDKVGNSTTTGASATSTARINFTVDDTKPTFVSATAGIGAVLDTSTTDSTTDYKETASAEWIKLVFSEGLDSSSVAASDFSIDTGDATSVLNVTTITGVDDEESIVYVNVAALSADATPKVKLVSAVKDKAGNASSTDTSATTTTQKTASDTIKPTLGVSTSASLGKKADVITITVTSDEALAGSPVVTIDTSPATTVGVTSTGTNTWSGSYTVASGDVAKHTITAAGNDKAATPNAGTKTATFEADDVAPTITFNDSADVKLESDDVQYLAVNANDGAETYTVGTDGHTTTTITAASLETLDEKDGTATDTVTIAVADLQTSNDKDYVYGASSLAVGFYELSVTAADDAGNSATGTLPFEVIDRQPTSIALNLGWNLISLPAAPSDASIETVLADPSTGTGMTTISQVYSLQGGVWHVATYDADTGAWDGTLTQISDGNAYWVKSESFDPIKYVSASFDPVASQPQYKLSAGWNAIGVTSAESEVSAASYLASLGSEWSTLRSYDSQGGAETLYSTGVASNGFATETADLNGDGDTTDAVVKAGNGYFVFVKSDVDLAP
jgi:hypothetical protein